MAIVNKIAVKVLNFHFKYNFNNNFFNFKTMSKKVLFLLIAVLTASYAQAQLSIGARAGVNLTNFLGEFTYNNREAEAIFKPGFQVGAVLNGARNDVFSLEGAFMFSQMGAQVQEKGDDESTNFTLNYFDVSLHPKFRFGNFFVQAGPYVGIGLQVRKKSESSSFDDSEFRSTDFGIGAGAGYRFGPVQAALNAKIGALSILDNSTISGPRNFGVALTATYYFELF